MPNNQHSDYVPPHKHAADDIEGMGVLLFPPTIVANGVASAPTSTSDVYALLTNMLITTAPPAAFPVWQAQITFTGTFAHSASNGTVGAKLVVNGTDVPAMVRTYEVPAAGGLVSIALVATVQLVGGTAPDIRVQWANVTNSGTATAQTTNRRLEVAYTPYLPAAL